MKKFGELLVCGWETFASTDVPRLQYRRSAVCLNDLNHIESAESDKRWSLINLHRYTIYRPSFMGPAKERFCFVSGVILRNINPFTISLESPYYKNVFHFTF